jgi:hypothetical protein
VYHALLSVEKSDSESLDLLINRVDEHIRVIKSPPPSSFTLDNLFVELAVMAIIRALPHSFGNIVRTISILDKFDKPSVIQSLRKMDQTCSNLLHPYTIRRIGALTVPNATYAPALAIQEPSAS